MPARPEPISKMSTLTVPALITSLAVACAVLPSMVNGPGMSADSHTYVSTAKNLVDGNGMVTALGNRPTEFAPLFPLTLAALMAVGASAGLAAVLLNAVALCTVSLAVCAWSRSRDLSNRWRHGLLAAVMFSYPLSFVSTWAWSEMLFVAFAVVALLGLERHSMLMATVGASLAMSTRYAGVVVLLIGVLHLLRQQRWKQASVFALVSPIPLTAWLAWNAGQPGAAAGERGAPKLTFIEASGDALFTLGKWVTGPLPAIATGVGFLLVCLSGYLVYRRNDLAAGFVLFHTMVIVLTAGVIAGINPPNDRLLAPVVPALAIAVVPLLAQRGRRVASLATIYVVAVVTVAASMTIYRTFLV